MSDDVTLTNVTMIQATGQKATMPEVAPDGQLLVARTPGQPTELWCGTGDSVEQISTGGGGGGAGFPDQTGNANRFLMTDGENAHWSPVPMRNIGEAFFSTVPVKDAGAHLADGSLVLGGGIYSEFVNYMANLYGDGTNVPDFFAKPQEGGPYINITSEGTAISGGDWSPQPKDNAFDGSTSTHWGSSQMGSDNILGVAYIGRSGLSEPVKKVRLYQGFSGSTDNYCTSLKFQYSNDGTNWIDIDTITNGINLTWQEWELPSYTPTGSTHSFRVLAYGGFTGVYNNNWIVPELELYTRETVLTPEEWWEEQVALYGVCDKFVYDEVNDTIRLPKYDNKLYTGGGHTPVKGDGTCLGLSDGTSTASPVVYSGNNLTVYRTALVGSSLGSPYPTSTDSFSANVGFGITTDATKSGIIADIDNTTSIVEGYWYIVIANCTKDPVPADLTKLDWAPFSINRGTVTNGKNATLLNSGSTLMCSPCTVTTVERISSEFLESTSLNCSSYADGEYHVFIDSETGELSLYSNFFNSQIAPSNPSLDYAWLDTSTVPANLKIYSGSAWVKNNALVKIGTIIISSGSISSVSNLDFNSPAYSIYVDSPYQEIVTLTDGTVPLKKDRVLYALTATDNTTFTFSTTNILLDTHRAYTFELLIYTSTARTFSFPSSVTWQDSKTPDMSSTGYYFFAFRTLDNGTTWKGSLQGVWQ